MKPAVLRQADAIASSIFSSSLRSALSKFLSTASVGQTRKPLQGIRVIECGHLIAGPFAGTILAYFGAEVIKVEPRTGDQSRDYRNIHHKSNQSLWWYSLGRNKKTISVDLRHPNGQALLRDLASKSDVLIENFKPGRMESWNVGPDDLSPELIYTRVSGYGQTGPYSHKPGFASVCEAMGGFRFLNGSTLSNSEKSIRPNLSLGDTLAGIHAALGTLVALLGKSRNGGGQVVDVAIYESVFNMLEGVLPEYSYDQAAIRGPSGSTITGIVPSNTYPCADGSQVVIGANTDTLYQKLMADIVFKNDSRKAAEALAYDTNASRVTNQGWIDGSITCWTMTMSSREVVEILEGHGIPVGLIYSVADIANDPHYAQRKMLESVVIPETGERLDVPAICPKLLRTPGKTEHAGKPIGSDTTQVLSNVLNYTAEKIEALQADSVVYQRKK